MQFLQPNVLWALLALSIPIIIHLFHFRRFKKVYFTNVSFLKEVKQEVSTRRRLRNLLVLLMRLLAMTALILAFAQPVIQRDDKIKSGTPHIVMIVDNSFSMLNEYQDALLLERAKQRAFQIVDASPSSSRFLLMTNDLEARHLRFTGADEVTRFIEQIEESPRPIRWQTLHQKARRLLRDADSDNLQLYTLSDFVLRDEDLEYQQDSLISYTFLPFVGVQQANVAIDSCWFLQPTFALGQEIEVAIRIQNYSSTDVPSVRLEAAVEGQDRPISTFSLDANGYHMDTLRFIPQQAGWSLLEVRITDYPVQFDDTYYLSYQVSQNQKVLLIYDDKPDKYVRALLQASPVLAPTTVQSLEVPYGQLEDYALVVVQELPTLSSGLQSALDKYVRSGGQLFFIPDAQGKLEDYNAFLGRIGAGRWEGFRQNENQVASIVQEESLFSDVFSDKRPDLTLPKVQGHFKLLASQSPSTRSLLRFRDGQAYLYRNRIEEGQAYLLLAPIDLKYNNLVGNAEIFVPMLYKMALGRPSQHRTNIVIGQQSSLPSPARDLGSEEVLTISDGDQEFIPRLQRLNGQLRVELGDELARAGIIKLRQGDELLALWAANYDRKESKLDILDASTLESWFGEGQILRDSDLAGDSTQILQTARQGKPLWKWCIIFALIFLGLESILLRWWKN